MLQSASVSLIDKLYINLNFTYASSLRSMDVEAKSSLIKLLSVLNPNEYPLDQWNDVLEYIVNAPAETSPENARNKLIELLSSS